MNPVIKRIPRDYSLAFKLTIVDQVEKGEMTYKQAQDRYGIQGRSTVLCWLRKHGQLDCSLGTPLIPIARGHLISDKPLPQTPEQRTKSWSNNSRKPNRKLTFLKLWLMCSSATMESAS